MIHQIKHSECSNVFIVNVVENKTIFHIKVCLSLFDTVTVNSDHYDRQGSNFSVFSTGIVLPLPIFSTGKTRFPLAFLVFNFYICFSSGSIWYEMWNGSPMLLWIKCQRKKKLSLTFVCTSTNAMLNHFTCLTFTFNLVTVIKSQHRHRQYTNCDLFISL